LSIEAIDPASARLLARVDETASMSWHAAALLIGKADTTRRKYPLNLGSVEHVSRGLCRAAGR
jgi:hypothetical protein